MLFGAPPHPPPPPGPAQDLQDLITAALQHYGQAGLLDATPTVPLALERDKQAAVRAVCVCGGEGEIGERG